MRRTVDVATMPAAEPAEMTAPAHVEHDSSGEIQQCSHEELWGRPAR